MFVSCVFELADVYCTHQQQLPEVSGRKGVFRNFAKFTGKHLCQSPQVFSCEFCKFAKNTFFTEHLRTTASDTSFADLSGLYFYLKNDRLKELCEIIVILPTDWPKIFLSTACTFGNWQNLYLDLNKCLGTEFLQQPQGIEGITIGQKRVTVISPNIVE